MASKKCQQVREHPCCSAKGCWMLRMPTGGRGERWKGRPRVGRSWANGKAGAAELGCVYGGGVGPDAQARLPVLGTPVLWGGCSRPRSFSGPPGLHFLLPGLCPGKLFSLSDFHSRSAAPPSCCSNRKWEGHGRSFLSSKGQSQSRP